MSKECAATLLRRFKGGAYRFGTGCFDEFARHAAAPGTRVAVVASGFGKDWGEGLHIRILAALREAKLELAGDALIPGAAPNSPFPDVLRVADRLRELQPEAVISVGGGSNIDATKASLAHHALGDVLPNLHDYFGVGHLSEHLRKHGRKLLPLTAVQLASASGAHLTRYSNLTDPATMQKLLIIDEAGTPPRALFDYGMTKSMSADFTMDGGFDGISHCLEVYMGAPESIFESAAEIALCGIKLILEHLGEAVRNPESLTAREGVGLGTDLGGYAIMTGGTNGAHLNSFSLIDLLPHGRAVALLNPYYLVLFAPAISERLPALAELYQRAGYLSDSVRTLTGRELGLAIAEAMLKLASELGFPVALDEVPGFSDAHVERMLRAAKNPVLRSKLENMPVRMTAETVDECMGAVLRAARSGTLEAVPFWQ